MKRLNSIKKFFIIVLFLICFMGLGTLFLKQTSVIKANSYNNWEVTSYRVNSSNKISSITFSVHVNNSDTGNNPIAVCLHSGQVQNIDNNDGKYAFYNQTIGTDDKANGLETARLSSSCNLVKYIKYDSFDSYSKTYTFDINDLDSFNIDPSNNTYYVTVWAWWYNANHTAASDWFWSPEASGSSLQTLSQNVTPTSNKFAVTFDSQGGSSVASQTINYNSSVTQPTAPTKTGYTFGGWYKEAACTNAWNFTSDKVVAQKTLYAKWTTNSYAVTFDSQGGSSVTSQTINYNSSVTQPTAPTKTGYTFGGWYKEAACTNAWNFTSDKITVSTTLYAKWTINSYDVTFNSQEGTEIDGQTVEYNASITEPTAPTKTGYTFGGWYKEAICTNVWNFTSDKMLASNLTLYAKWSVNPYTVIFNSQEGTEISSQTVNYNSLITEPTAPTKTGYTFDGWFLEEECINSWSFTSDKMSASNLTLYAKWNINVFEVTFVTNEGTEISKLRVSYNNIVGNVLSTRTNYDLVGWYKDAELTQEWNILTDKVTSNITLYVKWEIKKYEVTLNQGNDDNNIVLTVDAKGRINMPENPVKKGYKFGGWYKDKECTVEWDFENDVISSTTTLYAKWTKNNITVWIIISVIILLIIIYFVLYILWKEKDIKLIISNFLIPSFRGISKTFCKTKYNKKELKMINEENNNK